MKPIILRGGGDLATGTIHRLCKSGYPVIVFDEDRSIGYPTESFLLSGCL